MLKGYADEHVVFGLVQALRQRGMDVVRVQDRGREQADDAALLNEALADGRVMLTNDTDFLALAAERAARQEKCAPIFFWP
jgi:predicted nuclease of predicted toxin-antitoxin system